MRTDPRRPQRLSRQSRGQAMAEYSSIVFVLALSGGVSIVTILPLIINGLDTYLQGIYYCLSLAIP